MNISLSVMIKQIFKVNILEDTDGKGKRQIKIGL